MTRDAFFGGRLVLSQPRTGHRAGTDAVLLAAAVPRDFSGLVYDAGAGVGVVGLGIAIACPGARVGLIENDPLAATIAEANVAANGLGARARVHCCDLLSEADRAAAGVVGGADLVVTNPPFYAEGAIRASPDPRRRAAHVEGVGGLETWLAACLALLSPSGTLIAIHMPEALAPLLRALARGAGAITLLPVHTKTGAPAKRLLVRATRGSRAPLVIAPGLLLHDGEGRTAIAERINRGETGIAW
jgi:tRNA1(Val) A37 N6-methylase TrmN6